KRLWKFGLAGQHSGDLRTRGSKSCLSTRAVTLRPRYQPGVPGAWESERALESARLFHPSQRTLGRAKVALVEGELDQFDGERLGHFRIFLNHCAQNSAQRLGIRTGEQINERAIGARARVVRRHCQRAFDDDAHLIETPLFFITLKHLLQEIKVARIQFESVAQIALRVLPSTLAPIHVAGELEDERLIRKRALRRRQFAASTI